MRMKNAIFDLFEKPHNRFKIFKNGRMLYTESTGTVDSVQRELQGWLGPKPDLKEEIKDDGKNIHRLASLLCTALLSPIEVDETRITDFITSTTENMIAPIGKEGGKKNIFYAPKNFDNLAARHKHDKAYHSPSEDTTLSTQIKGNLKYFCLYSA